MVTIDRRPRILGGIVSPQIFGGYVILGDLSRLNFSHVRVGCIFHAADHFGLERLSLFYKFQNTL
jgi:hypothetical protein